MIIHCFGRQYSNDCLNTDVIVTSNKLLSKIKNNKYIQKFNQACNYGDYLGISDSSQNKSLMEEGCCQFFFSVIVKSK